MGGSTARVATAASTGGLSEARRKAKKLTALPGLPPLAEGLEIPGRESEEVQEAALKERRQLRLRRGRRSTMLTNLRQASGAPGEQLG